MAPKRVKVVYKQPATTDIDKDCFPLDQHLDDHVNEIWLMMVAEHPELAKGSSNTPQDVQNGPGASDQPIR